MMRSQGLWIILPIAFAFGCDESSGGSAGAAASASAAPTVAAASGSVAPVASSAKPHPMMGRHGGIASGLFRATNDLTLTDTQKDSLAKLEATLKADDDGIRTAMKAFRADLLAGVKAGKLDTAKMTADDAVVDKAIADHQDKEATALNSLHTLLDPAQRTAAVAAVRAKQADHEAHMAGWMKDKDGDGGPPDWGKKRLDKLTADLTLDAGQQKQVTAILTKAADPPNAAGMQSRWDDHKKRIDALLTSFAGDTFDAKKADLTILPGKTAHDPMDHMVAFFTQLLPILHPDQRDKLAASMDRPFGAREGTPGMGGPSGGQGMPHHPVDDIAFPFVEPSEGPGGDMPPTSPPSPTPPTPPTAPK
jgi:Spy/CpxP family protein refolding chaperone